MDAPIEDQILHHLTGYLRGDLSLNELRLWLMPQLWSIDREIEPRAFQVASKIALFIAEYGAGHRTEPELRELLAPDRLLVA